MRAGIVLLSTLLLVDVAAAFMSAPCSALRKNTGSIGHTPLCTPSISPRCLAARRPTRMAETSAYDVVPCTRRFEFVPYGEKYSGGEKSICVDGLVLGADLDLSHRMNNKTPTEYKVRAHGWIDEGCMHGWMHACTPVCLPAYVHACLPVLVPPRMSACSLVDIFVWWFLGRPLD